MPAGETLHQGFGKQGLRGHRGQVLVHGLNRDLARVKYRRLGHKKPPTGLHQGGSWEAKRHLDQAAVFLAGSFSLIRADLPLRSRR